MDLPAEVSSATQKSCRGSGSYAPVRTRAIDSHRRQSIIVFTGFGFAINYLINLNTTASIVLIGYCRLELGNSIRLNDCRMNLKTDLSADGYENGVSCLVL